ncbi:MAG TPA: type II CAAX endopeptidase family protein [Longimicrobiales bacterium]
MGPEGASPSGPWHPRGQTIADQPYRLKAFLVAVVVLAAAVVWTTTGGLRWPARVAVVFLLTILPAFLAAQERHATEIPAEIPRLAIYVSSAVMLWIMAVVILLAGLTSGFTPAQLGLQAIPLAGMAGWTGAIAGGGILLLVGTRALRLPESPMLMHVLPRNGRERLAFVGVAITAGVAEELIFRGFLIAALAAVTGSQWFAAALSSVLFGFLHNYQRLLGALRAAVLGFGLALPLLMTGSLLPSIIAHAAYDIVAGVFLARWLLVIEEAGTQASQTGTDS